MSKRFVHYVLLLMFSSPLCSYNGPATQRILDVGSSQIELRIFNDGDTQYDEKLTHWVHYGVEAMTLLYGDFPLPRAGVSVFFSGPDREIVPWGEVKRSRMTAAHLYVDQTRSLKALKSDWTLIHELSHMIHPYLGKGGRWLAEGIATYYQNVLQARAGTLTPKEAWQKLHEGFERGIGETQSGQTLSNASINMHRNQDYMRVYWTGTAIAMLADWQLRKDGGSLDNTLLRFRNCCLPARKSWSARDFLQKLDRLSGSSVFTGLYERYIHADQFPQLEFVYTAFGLNVVDGEIQLSSDASDVGIRRAIMQENR